MEVATLVGELGTDVAKYIDQVGKAFRERDDGRSLERLKQMVSKDLPGHMSGRALTSDLDGIWGSLKVSPKSDGSSDNEIQCCLVTRFMMQAIRCLQKGKLARPTEGDLRADLGPALPYLGLFSEGPASTLCVHVVLRRKWSGSESTRLPKENSSPHASR